VSAAEVDAYLAALPADQRAALADLRRLLRRLLPDHAEVMSYAMPGFRQPGPKGRMVAGYAAFSRHLGFYPHSGNILPQLATETIGWKTSKSGILFTPETPLPEPLVARILTLRQSEIAAMGR
jgi:uncharacterized protein YdhG (YjbR/CyaY superfamily)